jgi:hypothetical protein
LAPTARGIGTWVEVSAAGYPEIVRTQLAVVIIAEMLAEENP